MGEKTPMDDDEDLDAWCLDCGDTFRYDDTGGYNPPCRCGEKCRSCCDHECERDDGYERSEDSYPDDESPFGGASPTEETR